MKIRAITAFIELYADDTETPLARAATFLAAAAYSFQQAGFAVQSRRVATQPFPQIDMRHGPARIPDLAARLREESTAYGIGNVGLGPVSADDDPDYVDAIPDILRRAESTFASVEIASRQQKIDLGLLRHTAHIIREISQISPDGMANSYFAAIANCPPGSPFFPVAYHAGGMPRFALAIEAADLVMEAFKDAPSPEAARQRLTEQINLNGHQLCVLAKKLAADYGFGFGGL